MLDVQHLKGLVWTVEIDWQVRLLCPWTRHLTGLPLSLRGWTVVIGGVSWL